MQLLGDEQRGWAWTRAFQGAPAKEIHLCGDISALQLIKKLAKQMNEEVELREYKRFTPLKVRLFSPPRMPKPGLQERT